MIDDLLDINRIAAGKIVLDVQPTDLVGVVEMAIESLKPAAEVKKIVIATSYDAAPEPVQADPARLQQAVSNLLSNAIKFTPEGGRVDVRVRRRPIGWQVTVADTGRGITPEFLPHVFERFRQGDASHARSAGGLGLGLAIVKSLVEMHGGSVQVQSEGEGKGAQFTIQLPRVMPGQPAVPESRPVEPPRALPTLDRVRILVVDDEADVRDLLRRVLEGAGATVTVAGSVLEAMKRLDHAMPDVVVSDIGMPGEDGYALLRRLRARSAARGGNIPALALTAFARSEDRQRALDAGYHAFVAKPVEPGDLIRALARLANPAPAPGDDDRGPADRR
jgi:CheY-like chemotaxis protein